MSNYSSNSDLLPPPADLRTRPILPQQSNASVQQHQPNWAATDSRLRFSSDLSKSFQTVTIAGASTAGPNTSR